MISIQTPTQLNEWTVRSGYQMKVPWLFQCTDINIEYRLFSIIDRPIRSEYQEVISYN